MAEDDKRKDVRKGEAEGAVQAPNVFFPWIVCFSLTTFLVLGVAAFFQAQLMSLQQELAALQVNLTRPCRDEDRPKVLRKRSSSESENGATGESGTGNRKLLPSAVPRNPIQGIQAAHLQGSLPFQHVLKQGRIGPWRLTSTQGSFVRMRGKGTELEVLVSGVYYIYAQVYYLTSHPLNSYQILSYNGTEDRKQHRNVVTCSSQGWTTMGEVSCYTGLVRNIEKGQRLYLNQIEQDRMIHFTNGGSYFGIVLLRKRGALCNR